MRVALIVLASAGLVTSVNLLAQPQVLPLRFEVASVKPNPGADDRPVLEMPGVFLPGGRRFAAGNAPLLTILRRAYPEFAGPDRIIAPEWIADARFDVDARAAAETPLPRLRLMLRQLLADRFGLQSHTETRSVEIYQLVIAGRDRTLGPRMKPESRVCDAWNAQRAANAATVLDQPDLPIDPPQPKLPAGALPCGPSFGFRDGLRTLSLGGGEVSRLATMLGGFVRERTDTTVVDATGLTGRFDIDLSWEDVPLSPDNAQGMHPSLANALQAQLGLKLQLTKRMAEVLVIDRIERPTPN